MNHASGIRRTASTTRSAARRAGAIDGPLLSERLPAFLQLDLRLDHAWRRSWGVLNLYLDVQNVTNRDTPEGVTYNKDFTQRSYTTGLPVFPSIGAEYIP
jgi:hypothetical protein